MVPIKIENKFAEEVLAQLKEVEQRRALNTILRLLKESHDENGHAESVVVALRKLG